VRVCPVGGQRQDRHQRGEHTDRGECDVWNRSRSPKKKSATSTMTIVAVRISSSSAW
jgi:hypothetical protein